MKKWMAVLVMMLVVAPMARADEASKTAKVHQLFIVMHMDRTMQQMIDQVTVFMKQQMQQTMKQSMASNQLTPTQQKLTDEYLDKTMKLAFDTMSWTALEPDYTKIYADTFTEDEIDAITVFYKSPAGQTMLEKTPDLTAASMKVVQVKMVDLQPKMKVLQDEYVQKMKDTATQN